MNEDLYTKIYVKASESDDKELIEFLENVSVEINGYREEIKRLEKDIEELTEDDG